jgi:hypothetical protein
MSIPAALAVAAKWRVAEVRSAANSFVDFMIQPFTEIGEELEACQIIWRM